MCHTSIHTGIFIFILTFNEVLQQADIGSPLGDGQAGPSGPMPYSASTDFEVKALLVKCSKELNGCGECVEEDKKKKNPPSTEEPESFFNGGLRECIKKLVLTIKINNQGPVNCKREYIIIDHVFDSVTQKKQSLLNPYVLKIQQKPVMQVFKMKLESVVNSEPVEKVVNKNVREYTGCNTGHTNPTCGEVKYNNEIIPYSTGFCCSCNKDKDEQLNNDAMDTLNELGANDSPNDQSYIDPDLLIDTNMEGNSPQTNLDLDGENGSKEDVNNPAHPIFPIINSQNSPVMYPTLSTEESEDFNEPSSHPIFPVVNSRNFPVMIPKLASEEYGRTDAIQSYENREYRQQQHPPNNKYLHKINRNNEVNDEFGAFKETNDMMMPINRRPLVRNVRNLRQSKAVDDGTSSGQFDHGVPHKFQKRGGQDCFDTFTPPNVDPEKYHDSTHCLEFSDVWYSVYKLCKPKITHSLEIFVYEKHEDSQGHFHWKDLTKGVPLVVGNEKRQARNCDGNIIGSYTLKKPAKVPCSIPFKTHRLLIPEVAKQVDISMFPEVQGGPDEYLVVNENKIQADGKSCNKAGVGYEAFVNQRSRCNKVKNSCLSNQPKHLWQHDHDAESQNRRGCYFLKYYGHLPADPIRGHGCNGTQTLNLLYDQCSTSMVQMEIRADFNVVLSPNSLAIITEVNIDSSHPLKTQVTAKIFNSGLVSSVFYITIRDCPMQLPASFSNIASKPALIAPQHQHVFNLEINCELPSKSFFCTLEVVNRNQELIAIRRILFAHLDRCICVWHCTCTCLLADKRLKCAPLSLEYYHAAGFQGGLPMSLQVVRYSLFDDVISVLSYIFLFCCLTLLLMGFLKALVGICVIPVSLWGFDVILGLPKPMKSYFEKDLKQRTVVYDDDGWPVHPQTGKKVRNIPRAPELAINFLFFVIYPCATIMMIVKKLCFRSSTSDDTLKGLSDLDLCDCKAQRISKISKTSLQVSTNKKKDSKTAEVKEEIKEEKESSSED